MNGSVTMESVSQMETDVMVDETVQTIVMNKIVSIALIKCAYQTSSDVTQQYSVQQITI